MMPFWTSLSEATSSSFAGNEEGALEEFEDRLLANLWTHNRGVLQALGLDPRRSVLFDDLPELLARACDPQSPVIYRPALREFALAELSGGTALVIRHCPWSGKLLPASVSDDWFDLLTAELGTDDWRTEEARSRLPEAYFAEDWWIARHL
ncbi:DUF6980 family protein [Roseibium sp. Sym1]|uniref:DUF6980 family protein n=1 Tax=Roseibium sp. Sym1 TaxID=3016006 RepID=UPI0022B5DA2C|nr:hypothetical protein [Roseibium sp. Sym1]